RNYIVVGISYQSLKLRFRSSLEVGLGPDIIHSFLRHLKRGPHCSRPWSLEANRGGFVPHQVVWSQRLHQHEHEEWVTHRIQRAAKVSARPCLVPESQSHFDFDGQEIIGDSYDSDSGP